MGAGLSEAEFAEQVRAGSVRHVGLPESLAMVAGSLGWSLDEVRDTIEPVIAQQAIVTGVRARGSRAGGGGAPGGERRAAGGVEVVRLELQMYVGAPDARDEIEIDGDPPIRAVVPGGFPRRHRHRRNRGERRAHGGARRPRPRHHDGRGRGTLVDVRRQA